MRFALIILAFCLPLACSPQTDTGAAAATEPPLARVETSLGTIVIALHQEAAPVTSANFIAHAEAGNLDGGSFYRSSRPGNARADAPPMYLIQGGHSFDGLPGAEGIAHEPTQATGLSHVRGAVSMARDEPGTATTEFFITINDVPGLDSGPEGRNPDGAGYAVFGEVVEGMDVVEAIWQAPAGREDAPEGFQTQFLIEPVTIEAVRIERRG